MYIVGVVSNINKSCVQELIVYKPSPQTVYLEN